MTRIMGQRSIAMRALKQRTLAVRRQRLELGGGALTGIENLATSAIVYSQTIAPKLYYRGQSYDGTTWPGVVGPTLVLAGSGAAPVAVDAPSEAVHSADAGVALNYGSGKHFSSTPDVASGDVVGDDMLLELWFKPGSNSLEFVFSKRGSTTQGWFVFSSSTQTNLSLRQASTTVAGGWPTTAGTWVHLVFGVDRDSSTGVFCIKNGVLEASSFNPTALTTLTSSVPVFIGAANVSGSYCSGSVALAALWTAPSWINAADKPALETWALARYRQSMGL